MSAEPSLSMRSSSGKYGVNPITRSLTSALASDEPVDTAAFWNFLDRFGSFWAGLVAPLFRQRALYNEPYVVVLNTKEGRTQMKTWLWTGMLAAAIALPALRGVARAQSTDNDGCTNATLKGDYAFAVTGWTLSPGPLWVPSSSSVSGGLTVGAVSRRLITLPMAFGRVA
jgi:hypothetical protein